MRPSTLYAKNLEKYSRDNAVEAYRLDQADCSRLSFCRTYQDELNLVDRRGEHSVYLHAQEGAELEAQYWVRNVALDSADVLFVFGLGLGYYYLPLKEWLKGSKERYLVFLEDDPAIIRCFLHSELAGEILDHPQVVIKQIARSVLESQNLERLRAATFDLAEACSRMRMQFSALMSYFIFRFEVFNALAVLWPVNLLDAVKFTETISNDPVHKYKNYYANIPFISRAAIGTHLEGDLRGIPAVLCGAGPSLAKQLSLLSTLGDKALIIAAGSAINALTQAAIMPHMAGAIDPTEAQASRMLTSYAFDVPAFYQNTFYDKALVEWHGPLVYMQRDRRWIRIPEWFEDQLGIGTGVPFFAGESTSNFLLNAACFLECNPVVMVGMDLAYTEGSRYVKGVSAHPADDPDQHKALVTKEETIAVKGVDGNEVYTTLHWCYEAGAFGDIKKDNPNIIILNATEGGMPILTIDNVSFAASAKKYFVDSWDIYGWLHGAIQNASFNTVSEAKAIDVLETWQKSLKRCNECIDNLIVELKFNAKRLCDGPYSGRAALWQVEMKETDAYVYFLESLDWLYDATHALQKRAFKYKKRMRAEIAFEVERCLHFKKHLKEHLKDVQEGISAYAALKTILEKKSKNAVRLEKGFVPPNYWTKEGRLKIDEIDIPFNPPSIPKSEVRAEAVVGMFKGKREGQMLCFYPDGAIKAETFYRDGKLHGPWTFFAKTGMVLYRSWYVEGKRHGKSVAYYHDGSLYSVRGYRDDLAEGEHRYYYPDGLLKTSASFKQGKLDGIVRLYHANGIMKKEQHFSMGQLDGQERLWSPKGVLLVEATYVKNKPVGMSRLWNENGMLAREVDHTKD